MIRELVGRLFGGADIQARSQDTTDIGWWRGLGIGRPSAAGFPVSPETAMESSPVFAAVKVVSEDVAKIPARVYRWEEVEETRGRMVRKRWRKVEVPGHPIQALLDTPNGWQDRVQFKEAVQAQATLNGNGVAWIERLPSGLPYRLHPVPAPFVAVLYSPNGSVFFQFSPPEHLRDVLPSDPVPARDVIHVMGTSMDGFWGLSPVHKLRDAVGLSRAMEEYGSELFKNGADPGGVLEAPPGPPLQDAAFQRLRRQWAERYEGRGNRRGTLILEGGMKYAKLAMTSQDAEFLAGRRFQVEDIARAFRVPPHKLMHLDQMTLNNVEHLSLGYINDTLMPWLERWEAQLSSKLFLPSERETFFVEFDLSRLARGDMKSRADATRAAVMAGIMTINEARFALDLDPVDGGDVRLEPINMVAVEPGRPRPVVQPKDNRLSLPDGAPAQKEPV